MTDVVSQAIYRMGVEGKPQVDAAVASVDNLAVKEEKLTRATRTSADSIDRLLGRLDPRIRAEQQLQRTLEQINRYEQEGIGTVEQRSQAMIAATERYTAAINKLGKTGLETQSVQELNRINEIAGMKAAQAGQTFSAELDARLIAGVAKSARDSASVFSAELDRIDQIAQLKANQIGAAFSAGLNQSFGIGVTAKSARESAAVFEEAARAQDQMAAKAAALRAELNPLAAAEDRLNAEMMQYAELAQKGAISADELGRAQSLATQRYEQSVQRIRGAGAEGAFIGAGNAAKLSAFQIQNLSFQMQDVGQAILSGQPLFRTFIQQGSQIAQIFGPGAGVTGVLKQVGQAVVAYVTNPINIAFLAIAGAAAGIGAFFSLIRSGGSNAETVLAKHEDTIRAIKAAWDNAAEGPAKYSQAVQDSIRFQGEQGLQALQDLLTKQTKQIAARLSASPLQGAGFFASPQAIAGAYESEYGAAAAAIQKFVASVKQGTPDVEALNTAVLKLTRTHWDDPNTRSLVDFLVRLAREATTTEQKIRKLNDELERTTFVGARSAEGAAVLKAMTDTANKLSDLSRAQDAELQAIYAKSPSQKAAAARAGVLAQPQDFNADPTGAIRQAEAEKAAALALASANHALSEAYLQRKRSMDATIESARMDIALIGKGVGEQARLRKEFELTQAAYQAAVQAGVSVSEAELEAIKETAAAYGDLQEKIAKAQLASDLSFRRQTTLLSPEDVEIAKQLRSIYGDDVPAALASSEAAAIKLQTRIEDMVTTARQHAQDFVTTLVSGLRDGQSATEALANAFDDLSRSLQNKAITDLFSGNFFGAIVSGIGSLLSGLFGGLFGGQSKAKKQAQEAQQAYENAKSQIADLHAKLTGSENSLASAIADVTDEVDKYVEILKKAGKDAEAYQLQVEKAIYVAKLYYQAQQGINDAYSELVNGNTMSAYEQALSSAWDKAQALFQKILDAGYTLEQALYYSSQAYQAAVARIDAEEKQAKASEAASKAVDAVTAAQSALRSAYQAQASTLQETIDRTRQFVSSMRDLKDSLLIGDKSPLSPAAQLAEARRQYEETLAAAQSGNADAQSRLADAVTTYLDQAKSFYASSQAYADIFAQVQQAIDGVISTGTSQADTAQQQLDALKSQVSLLIDINDSTKSVAQAINELKAAIAAARSASSAAGQSYTYSAQAGGGIIGRFAPGGIVGNGWWNMDSVRARYAGGGDVMLAGGEGIINAAATAMIGPSVIDLINRTGSLPAHNDNGAATRRNFSDLARSIANGHRELADRLEAIEAAIRGGAESTAKAYERASKRPARPGTNTQAA